MKTLTLTNQKGGVGKSAIVCQFAYYLSKQGHKVLVIDLDHQGNASKALQTSGLAHTLPVAGSKLLTEGFNEFADPQAVITLIAADSELSRLEKQPEKHNRFANHLSAALKAASPFFDVCLIDTNPCPDIRMTASLVVTDYVLSPVQLNQEALDGIAGLLGMIQGIKKALNPKMNFIGILPNLVEATPFQKKNFEQLARHFASLMILLDDQKIAAIPTRTAVAEAQAAGQPIWGLAKTSAKDAWKQIQPVFTKIANVMEISNDA